MHPFSPRHFSELVGPTRVNEDSAFSIAPILAESLYQLTRLPHKYAYAYTALGSAPHLDAFESCAEFSSLCGSDGVDLDSESLAITKCLFELHERVWSPRVPEQDTIRGTYRDLGRQAEDPRGFALLSPSEIELSDWRYVRYHDDLPLQWTRCHRVGNDGRPFDSALVPSVFVYPGFGLRRPEQRIVPMASPGLAAGTDYVGCLLRGIYELVERDAMAIRWLARLEPPIVGYQSIEQDAGLRSAVDEVHGDGFTVEFRDLTLDLPFPVSLAVISNERRSEPLCVSMGLACSSSPSEALRKSFSEALLMMQNNYCFEDGGAPQLRTDVAIGDLVADHERHQSLQEFMGSQEHSSMFCPRDDSATTGIAPMEELEQSLRVLESHGLGLLFCDLTPPRREGRSNVCLTRALIPGLQPMTYEDDCWRLRNSRVFVMPQKMGRRDAPLGAEDLRLEVNPFAWHARTEHG